MVSIATPRRTRPSLIKRILPRTLFGRSILIIMAPLVLLQVISSWVFYDRHYETVTRRLAQGLAGDLATVIQMMIRNPGPAGQEQIFRLARNSMRISLTFHEGARLEARTTEASLNVFTNVLDHKLTNALAESVGRPFLIDTRSLDEEVEIQVQLADGVLQALVPRERLFSSTTYIFIMWMLGSSIILFGAALLFMRNQVKPIRRLAIAADGFGKGREVPDFKPEGATEVRQAAAAFIRMRDRIRRQMDQRTEFLAGVSHDLRTPLTRMKLQLALLGESPEAHSLQSDVTEMQRMVEGYLAFARGEGTEQAQDCSIAELLQEIVAQAEREGASVELQINRDATLPLRIEAMRRCLANLVSNAARHGSHVWLRATVQDRTLDITVDDDGPGIPPERRADALKPFFRLEQSRNPETGGVGLGLTIARDVVRNHGGELTLENAPEGGLRARIRLPL
jgi:two-component system osmolarity sensor histidine kinase EnvZ